MKLRESPTLRKLAVAAFLTGGVPGLAGCDKTQSKIREDAADAVSETDDAGTDGGDSSDDSDGDGLPDAVDNCVFNTNADQKDTDGDGFGDVCDPCPSISNTTTDTDNDSIPDECDNDPGVANPNQSDFDADGVADVVDNCIDVPNPDQRDADGDKHGDACDTCAPNDPAVTVENSDAACRCDVGEVIEEGSSIGECEPRILTCKPDAQGGTTFVTTQQPRGPENEEPNERDDDCDGTPDNGTPCDPRDAAERPCGSDVGACVPGVQRCIDDGDGTSRWGAECEGQVGPSAEVCDDEDNDCDGDTDENFRLGQACNGACGDGVRECNGVGADCSTNQGGSEYNPSEEICDGMDNNCDRRIDEGFNVGEVCNEPGVCGDGVIVCKTERATECSSLVRRGGLNPNDPESNDVDLCNDNLDNDCDGQVNDGCACNPGDTLPCGSDVGACAEGLRACVDGSYEDACNGGAEPAAETCDVTDLNPDGTDSDCNGQTDVVQFRLGQACEGACGEGERECDGQGGVRCSTDIDGSEFNPTSDLCDGADNDCDGIVDEGEGENAGYPLTRDLPGQNDLFATGEILAVPGECRFGTATCDDSTEGRSLRIVPHTQPVEERPNGLDDDCDGQPDEGFDCLPGDTQNCGALPERGICQQGEQTCTDAGEWGSCEGLIEPAVENPCNGLDDDCDGEADELAGVGAPRNAVGACADRAGVAAGVAEKVCENGVARLVPSNGPEGTNDQSTEELCNGQDDDCDGMTDENFTLSTGARVGEPTGLPGVCADGVVECATVRSVRPSVQPSVEQCNGADDDCDGTVDDGFRVGESCSNACGDVGVYTCNGVNSSRCSVQTPAEVAGNGVDDDCDGQTDE